MLPLRQSRWQFCVKDVAKPTHTIMDDKHTILRISVYTLGCSSINKHVAPVMYRTLSVDLFTSRPIPCVLSINSYSRMRFNHLHSSGLNWIGTHSIQNPQYKHRNFKLNPVRSDWPRQNCDKEVATKLISWRITIQITAFRMRQPETGYPMTDCRVNRS